MHRLLRTALLPLRRGVAAGLFLAVLAVVVMAASPRLHEEAHHHHDEEGHEDHGCVVTLFATDSAVDQVVTPQVLAGVYLPWVETLRAEHAREVFLARVEGRIRERAPPNCAV